MTVKKTISIPDDLNYLIENFNLRHPYENLNISQIAQKAIFQKISNEDPELVLKVVKKEQEQFLEAQMKEEEQLILEAEEAREQFLEAQMKEEEQLIEVKQQVKPVQKHVKNQNTLEIVCIECGKSFTAKRKTRKFCSGKCRTAYNRK